MARPASTSRVAAMLSRLRPILPLPDWLRHYRRDDASGDIVAGIVTAIVLVPQGMAFALLAGLPPQVGIYASILPPVLYALYGTSGTLAVGPVSIIAIMVANALSQLPDGSYTPVAAAIAIALMSGVLLVAMGIARLGIVSNFLAHPVLSGFTSAAAVLIVFSQLPILTGAHWPRLAEFAVAPVAGLRMMLTAAPATLAIGLGSIAVLLIAAAPLQRLLSRLGVRAAAGLVIPRAAPLVVVIGAAIGANLLDAGIAVIGDIPRALPRPSLTIGADAIAPLAMSALLISLVGYVESLSIAKMLANRRRQRIDPNQELIALGVANLSAGLSAGMPVAGGLSRTVVNFAAGARTQLASIITAVLVALAVLAFAPWLAQVPRAALAAIIIVSVFRLIDLKGAAAVWRYDRIDGAILALTAAGVLLLGIERGLGLGVALSLASLALRAMRPHVAILGRIRDSEHFRNVRRHKVETWPQLLLVRLDENLNFANAAFLESTIGGELAAHHEVRHVVLVLSSVNAIDSTALEALERVTASVRDAGVTMHLSDVKGPVMDWLRRARLDDWLGDGQVFLSAHQAVEALTEDREKKAD